jgi:hypothetical protein
VRTIAQAKPTQALEAAAEAVRRLADALDALALAHPVSIIGARPRLVPAPEEGRLLTLAQAADLFPGISKRTLQRLAKRCPEVVRRVGTRTWYERGALLRVTRRTA